MREEVLSPLRRYGRIGAEREELSLPSSVTTHNHPTRREGRSYIYIYDSEETSGLIGRAREEDCRE